jgi:hypothetical protein
VCFDWEFRPQFHRVPEYSETLYNTEKQKKYRERELNKNERQTNKKQDNYFVIKYVTGTCEL